MASQARWPKASVTGPPEAAQTTWDIYASLPRQAPNAQA
jgi:hypothetical protein